MNQHCTIIPPPPDANGITLARGTRVVLADGTELGRVSRIVLTAEACDIWRAEIHCAPQVGVMAGMAATIVSGRPSWWRRALCKLAGVMLDGTTLGSIAPERRAP